MAEVTIYHNPRCATSRAALKLLRDKGAAVRVIEYLKTPPSEAELRRLIGLLGIPAKGLLRKKEAAAAGIDPTQPDDALIKAMAANPIVIERPIVVAGGKARLGRPPARVLEVL